MNLYKNQKNAIEECIKNDFNSGIIAHATGTGKSITGISIIQNFVKNNLYKDIETIFWICEFKSILKELFVNEKFKSIIDDLKNDFNIYDFSYNKDKNWIEKINNEKKASIIFINRAFLTSQKKYKNLTKSINLIIHDECHSIKNKTTTEFYLYLNKFCNFKAIGLSATPLLKYPFEHIIHKYTLYNALCDKTIVRPKIVWFFKENKISIEEIIIEIRKLLENLVFKKIIIWCGLINFCKELSVIWNRFFEDYTICIDTSKNDDDEKNNFEKFKNIKKNAFLFCAAKHREGSDIKNLDCCIFMDKVTKRTPKTFVQCLGRVLRKEENKSEGLIIDIKAKSVYDVIKRMSLYLNENNNFPYSYSYSYNNKLDIKINNLLITENEEIKKENNNIFLKTISREELENKFKRTLSKEIKYQERYNYEMDLLVEKNLIKYINFAIEILELTKDIPHVTRGSCGSSLICYLLGITHVDPIKYNIKFERFLNKYRNNLPDIDFDFPHICRDEIFYRLEKKWPGKIARISNHVHYHEKSAKRAILKEMGYNKFIAKYEIEKTIQKLPKSKKIELNTKVKNLENKFRMYSLHCGGIIFYPDGVPDYLKHVSKSTSVINQITLNKYDVSNEKKFKIDILSSRALSQLFKVNKALAFKDFTDITIDENVMDIFRNGDNIGITLAESPLIKKAMLDIKPNNITDLALVLAIIRPAAKDARTIDFNKDNIVYDDDAIDLISTFCNVPFDKADYFRRNLNKDKSIADEMYNLVKKEEKNILSKKLDNLHGYSFCKAHAYSYAELIYKIAYIKHYFPKQFWEETLKNCETSYRKWVHFYEAYKCNVDFSVIKVDNSSIYSNNKYNNIYKLDHNNHFEKYGIWNLKLSTFYPRCYGFIKNNNYYFKGIIAQIKVLDTKVIYFICIGEKKYIEIITDNKNNYNSFKSIGIKGVGKLQETYLISIASKFYNYF